MVENTFKRHAQWLSLASATASLGIITFVQRKFVFDSGNEAGTLVLISTIFAVLTLIVGIISLPRWQGFVSLAAFGYVAYCILFTPWYAIS